MAECNSDNWDDILKQGFEEPRANVGMPWCKYVSKSPYGLFIPHEEIPKAGWIDMSTVDKFQPFVLKTRSEEEIGGIILPHPRLLISCFSPLLVCNSDGQMQCLYNKMVHGARKDAREITVGRIMFVYFLDDNNRLLHTRPFKMKSFGNFMFSFSVEFQEFINKMGGFMQKKVQKNDEEGDGKVHYSPFEFDKHLRHVVVVRSMSVFCPKFARKATKGQFACIVDSYNFDESKWEKYNLSYLWNKQELASFFKQLYNDDFIGWKKYVKELPKSPNCIDDVIPDSVSCIEVESDE
jgi:hypothetical protein